MADGPEIEVTPQMIEAAAYAYRVSFASNCEGPDRHHEIAESLLRAALDVSAPAQRQSELLPKALSGAQTKGQSPHD